MENVPVAFIFLSKNTLRHFTSSIYFLVKKWDAFACRCIAATIVAKILFACFEAKRL